MATLNVNEIFLSIQGEGTRAGRPCTLVRLSGCNLRCSWCDTTYTFEKGQPRTIDEVLAEVKRLGCPLVELTGGEPLLQAAAPELLRRLCDEGYEVLLETNGSIDISGVDERICRIVDIKCPSSGHADSFLWSNMDALTARDELKFVLADRVDYEYAREVVRQCRPAENGDRHRQTTSEPVPIFPCPVIFSAVLDRLPPATLAGWILEDRLDVRLGLQLHRIIWPGKDRGV